MKKIWAQPLNLHDHNVYDGEKHIQYERYPVSNRRKHCLWKFNWKEADVETKLLKEDADNFQAMYNQMFKDKIAEGDVVATNFTGNGIKLYGVDNYMETLGEEFAQKTMDFKPKWLWQHMMKNNIYYIDHHQAHAAHTFLSSGYEEADIFTVDGGGNSYRSIFVPSKNKEIINVGANLQIGWLWNIMTKLADFGTLQEGKLMGLVGYGSYDEKWYACFESMLEEFKIRGGKFWPDPWVFASLVTTSDWKVNMANTLQQFTLDQIEEKIVPLKTSDNLCVAGGVAYNGYMNEFLTKFWKNVYVCQAPGDEGQALGLYMHANYVLNNEIHVPDIYNGDEYEVEDESIFDGLYYEKIDDFQTICDTVAKAIANGSIVGWHQGRTESGNRALGNRSILADPRNPDIKKIINRKIKFREDFRPFAPSVLIEHYQDWFDTNQPSPHMSRIMPVHEDKRSVIPGVTHVDGTARIQTVSEESNKRYHQVISSFYKETGVPMVVNTSFNCQEPVVETPENAVDTFKRTGLDILVIGNYLVKKWKNN